MERGGKKGEETNTPRYYFLFVFSFAPSPISECFEPTRCTVGLKKDREFGYLLYLKQDNKIPVDMIWYHQF